MAGIDERIDRLLHPRDSIAQALFLGVGVFGNDLPDDDFRLVQQRRSNRQPRIDAKPVETHRQRHAAAALRHLERVDQFAARRELCDNHRDRLQHLDFVFGVMARRPVLHDEHAQDAIATQDRRAHQRMIDFLAGLRAIREIGMCLRVGQRERTGACGDLPDETLADPQPCAMHRFGPQSFGREQFEDLAGTHHIGRTDLGNHLGGNDADDAVEALLRATRPGHDAAQAA